VLESTSRVLGIATRQLDKEEAKSIDQLQTWNTALRELFSTEQKFSILLKLFDVLTRFKVFNDKKALLELPREQRLLLMGEGENRLL
jgi:hypothetical protein